MAARPTRAAIAAAGDVSRCPLSPVQLLEGALAAALEAGWHGEQARPPVVRHHAPGEPARIAEGYEYPVTMRHKAGDPGQSGTERCVVGRSVRQAHAAEAALRARVAKASAQIEALNQRGRGKNRFETLSAFRQAVLAIVQRDAVAAL